MCIDELFSCRPNEEFYQARNIVSPTLKKQKQNQAVSFSFANVLYATICPICEDK